MTDLMVTDFTNMTDDEKKQLCDRLEKENAALKEKFLAKMRGEVIESVDDSRGPYQKMEDCIKNMEELLAILKKVPRKPKGQ